MKAITLNADGKITSGIHFAIDSNNRVEVGSRWVLCHDNLINIPVKFFNDISSKLSTLLEENKLLAGLDNDSFKFIENFKIPERRFFRASLMAKHDYRSVNILVPEQDEKDNRLLIHFIAGSKTNVKVTSLCHKFALLEQSNFFDFGKKSNTNEKLVRIDTNGRFLFKVESEFEKTKSFILTWDGTIARLKPIKSFSSYDRFITGNLGGGFDFDVEAEEFKVILDETEMISKLNNITKKPQGNLLEPVMA